MNATTLQIVKIPLDHTIVTVLLDMLEMVHHVILMNVTPTSMYVTSMQIVPILLDHTTVTVLMDTLVMAHHVEVGYTPDDRIVLAIPYKLYYGL